MSKSALEIWDFVQCQADNSQQQIWSFRDVRKINEVNEVYISESRSNIKEIKPIIKGLSR